MRFCEEKIQNIIEAKASGDLVVTAKSYFLSGSSIHGWMRKTGVNKSLKKFIPLKSELQEIESFFPIFQIEVCNVDTVKF